MEPSPSQCRVTADLHGLRATSTIDIIAPLQRVQASSPAPILSKLTTRQPWSSSSATSSLDIASRSQPSSPRHWTAQLDPSQPSIGSRHPGAMAGLGAGFGRSTTMVTGPRLFANTSRQPLHNHATACLRRQFSSSTGSGGGKRPKFSQRLGEAMRNSKITWYQIPVGVGIGFLGLVQFYKVSSREQERRAEENGEGGRPKKRPRVRPEGPWYVAISQLLDRQGWANTEAL